MSADSPYDSLFRGYRKDNRCETRIKSLKAAGLGKLPFTAFTANQAWANLAMLVLNLTSWLQRVVLPAGHKAGSWDVKRWRYRVWSIAGKFTKSGHQPRLLINEKVPEAGLVVLRQEQINGLRRWWTAGSLRT